MKLGDDVEVDVTRLTDERLTATEPYVDVSVPLLVVVVVVVALRPV